MASTDPFFIRATVPQTAAAFTQTEIDLGAFVDALAETVLRIHSIEYQYSDDTQAGGPSAAGATLNIQSQLTTQTQTGLVRLDNKSVISSSIQMVSNAGGGNYEVFNVEDVGPQRWEEGYLVGVESIYLGTAADQAADNDYHVSILLECTSERLTKGAAMALALSQQ